jgi:hypothetical protein
MLNAFAKLETIMKSKVLLQSATKTVGAGRNKGDVSTSFRRENRLTDTYERKRLLTRDIAKQNFLFLLMEGWHYYEWPLGCHWDQGVSRGHSYREEVRLKDYLVYRPIHQGYTCFERNLMCIGKLRDAALHYTKAHEGHERRYLYRRRIQSYVLFWVIMFFWNPCVQR